MLYIDLCCMQCLLLVIFFLYARANNILLFWYLAGLYLIVSGLCSLFFLHDILIGFLWIIELGAGLIFFIFILYLTIFLYNLFFYKNYLFIYLYIILFILNQMTISTASYVWFIFNSYISFYAYYIFMHQTELYILYVAYYNWTWVEFMLLNILLLLNIFLCIMLFFFIKYALLMSTHAHWSQINYTKNATTFLFFRSQDFLKQQNTKAGVRQWAKRALNNYLCFIGKHYLHAQMLLMRAGRGRSIFIVALTNASRLIIRLFVPRYAA